MREIEKEKREFFLQIGIDETDRDTLLRHKVNHFRETSSRNGCSIVALIVVVKV